MKAEKQLLEKVIPLTNEDCSQQFAVDLSRARELIRMAREEERSSALDAFMKSCPCWSRFPQERKCNECIYAKEFVELLNKEETIHDKV